MSVGVLLLYMRSEPVYVLLLLYVCAAHRLAVSASSTS